MKNGLIYFLLAAFALGVAACDKPGVKSATESAPLSVMAANTPVSADGPRLALIIAQTNYEHKNDFADVELAETEADAIDKALHATGFTVRRERDLSKPELDRALKDFRVKLDQAGPGAIGFIYYTGHGA